MTAVEMAGVPTVGPAGVMAMNLRAGMVVGRLGTYVTHVAGDLEELLGGE